MPLTAEQNAAAEQLKTPEGLARFKAENEAKVRAEHPQMTDEQIAAQWELFGLTF
jgi:hypothetical protein